ncbi:MAG: hypothetical protein JJU34_11165 [Lunatimonas sp.]|uniref:hypothetical protein n=1 Tax=Lunatimonas sp. TaxID=2060141 RepID=UPI00263ACB79|nr:hypothetical protein [Lunatimonas sp.]MCC5937829.1 hypothetical protein [Lunatimonas sp.]
MNKAIIYRWGGFLMAAAVLTFTSCMPDPIEEGPRDIVDAPLSGLVASDLFEWSTYKDVEISVKGLPLPTRIERRLTLLTGGGDVFYAGLQSMSEDFKMSFSLPNHVNTLKMTYGDIEKEVTIESGKVVLDYLVALDNADLDE